MGWNKLGNCPIVNSVSPPLTFGPKVICWESLTDSLRSEALFPYNISSKEFQGQCIERSQTEMSSNQINPKLWQQHVRQGSFMSCYMTDNWKRQCSDISSKLWPWYNSALWESSALYVLCRCLQDLLPQWGEFILQWQQSRLKPFFHSWRQWPGCS